MVEPLLPPEPKKVKGGRPRASDRAALAGIILVQRSGMQWKHLPRSDLTKGSIWNGVPVTYGRQHAHMTAAHIRAIIEAVIARRSAA